MELTIAEILRVCNRSMGSNLSINFLPNGADCIFAVQLVCNVCQGNAAFLLDTFHIDNLLKRLD